MTKIGDKKSNEAEKVLLLFKKMSGGGNRSISEVVKNFFGKLFGKSRGKPGRRESGRVSDAPGQIFLFWPLPTFRESLVSCGVISARRVLTSRSPPKPIKRLKIKPSPS